MEGSNKINAATNLEGKEKINGQALRWWEGVRQEVKKGFSEIVFNESNEESLTEVQIQNLFATAQQGTEALRIDPKYFMEYVDYMIENGWLPNNQNE